MVGTTHTADSDSTMFGLLAHQRRRHALDILREADRTLSITELAIEIADRESTDPSATGERAQIDSVRLAMYHVHLPKLADGAIVEFDRDRKTAAITPSAGTVDDSFFSA